MSRFLPIDVEATLSQMERESIQRHLKWLLQTPAFANSKRSCAFLRYVVEETLAGRAAQIKERNIGVDVFGREVGFDPQEESLVRVSAGEVRRRLSRSYTAESPSNVRIELPVGSYCPVFLVYALTTDASALVSPSAPHTIAELVPPPFQASTNAASTRWKPGLWIGLAAFLCLLVAIMAGTSGYFATTQKNEQLDRLWKPFTNQKQPVLIALPAPTVYSLIPSGAPGPPGMIPAANLKASDGDYIGLGAGIGAARFAEQLTQRHQPFIVKSGKDVSFSDLSLGPAILLGGYSSSLGIELTRKLRFNLLIDAETNRIVDKQTGENQRWVIPRTGLQAEAHEGYALITILRDSETGHPLMIVAGMRISDTQAAVDFLTNEDYLRAYTQMVPHDWSAKNSQIVLHSFDHGGSPGRAKVVAWHLW